MVSPKSTLLFAAAASAAALSQAPTVKSGRNVQDCSHMRTPLCVCPEGTTLQEGTTRCHIKANAADVTAVVGAFQSTSWFGVVPDSVSGPDNAIGSSRTMTGGTPGGPKQFVEALFKYTTDNQGGFTMAYQLANGPIHWVSEETGQNGSYTGYWDYLETKQVGPKETKFDWRIYGCFSDDEYKGFQQFHETSLNNVNDILEAEGKSGGFSQAPFSLDSFNV